jgi:hypothetical protein
VNPEVLTGRRWQRIDWAPDQPTISTDEVGVLASTRVDRELSSTNGRRDFVGIQTGSVDHSSGVNRFGRRPDFDPLRAWISANERHPRKKQCLSGGRFAMECPHQCFGFNDAG